MDFSVESITSDHSVAFMWFALFRLKGSFEGCCVPSYDCVAYVYRNDCKAAVLENGEDFFCIFVDIDIGRLCC